MCDEIAALYASLSTEDKAKVDAVIFKLLNARQYDPRASEEGVTV